MRSTQIIDSENPPEEVMIENIDQKKASEVWVKLKEDPNAVDQEFQHPKRIVFCAKDLAEDYIQEPHYGVSIFKPDAEIDIDDDLVTFFLVQEDDKFRAQQDLNTAAGESGLTKEEINSFLDSIIEGTKITSDKNPGVEDIVHQTREKLN